MRQLQCVTVRRYLDRLRLSELYLWNESTPEALRQQFAEGITASGITDYLLARQCRTLLIAHSCGCEFDVGHQRATLKLCKHRFAFN